MPSRKRTISDVEDQPDSSQHLPSLLSRIRNDWRFANLMQFIHLFGSALKIDNELDVEVSLLCPCDFSPGPVIR